MINGTSLATLCGFKPQTQQRQTNKEATFIVNVHQESFASEKDIAIVHQESFICTEWNILAFINGIWLKIKVEPAYIYRRCLNVELRGFFVR